MRQFAALAALLVGGCLYTDPVNQRPVIDQMQVAPPPTRFDRDVIVTYDVYDPDGDDFDVHARVVEVPAILAGRYQVQFRPTGPGRYTVVVSATDSLGADSGERQIIVDVPNMAPVVGTPGITGDDGVANGLHALGTMFEIIDPTIDDDDTMHTLDYTLATQPAGSSAMIVNKTFIADLPGTYEVEASVTDMHGATGTGRASVFVATDRPPCIQGTTPDVSVQPNVPAFVGETKILSVTRVDDDLNPWPANSRGGAAQFQWLIKNSGDTDFRVIPGWTQASFNLDGSTHTIGDQVQVRVIVTDPQHTTLDCPAALPICPYVSSCAGWLTWDLEYFAP